MALERGAAPPFAYAEFEVAPSGALFAASIDNRSGNCSDFSGVQHPCATSGVHYGATLTKQGWTAGLCLISLLIRLLNFVE